MRYAFCEGPLYSASGVDWATQFCSRVLHRKGFRKHFATQPDLDLRVSLSRAKSESQKKLSKSELLKIQIKLQSKIVFALQIPK